LNRKGKKKRVLNRPPRKKPLNTQKPEKQPNQKKKKRKKKKPPRETHVRKKKASLTLDRKNHQSGFKRTQNFCQGPRPEKAVPTSRESRNEH